MEIAYIFLYIYMHKNGFLNISLTPKNISIKIGVENGG